MNHVPILIIGAGIAGLAAANALANQGIEVKILEARNRIGGRIYTDYSMGIPISLGAQWMHGTVENPIKLLADKLGLNYIDSGFNCVVIYDRKGELIPFDKVSEFFENFDKQIKCAKKFAIQQAKDVSLAQSLQKTFYFTQSDLMDDLNSAALMRLALYNGANVNLLSGRHWDDEKVLPGGNPMMLDGFTPIVDELAKNCSIQFNTTVTHIDYSGKPIIVKTQQGEWTADKILITVPLGILKKNLIHFFPDLPITKKESIHKLDMGVLNSLVVKFPEVFWPNVQGMQYTQPDLSFPICDNLNYFYKRPILALRVAGENAKILEELGDDALVKKAFQDLQKIYGQKIPEPEKYLITRWGQDPFSLGSYSYVPVSASGHDFDILAETVEDKLFFAGEATHRMHMATVHGAYLSGLREYEKIKSSCFLW